MNIIDARGLSCPQPVLMTKKALSSKDIEYTVLVDTNAAKENVSRFAAHSGYQVSCEISEGAYFTLSLKKV